METREKDKDKYLNENLDRTLNKKLDGNIYRNIYKKEKILTKMQEDMRKWQMAGADSHIIAGVSGGADSMCMLLALLELQKQFGYTLSVVHAEHGIRGEDSLRDAAFVRNFCEKKGLECTVCHLNVPDFAKEHGMGTEEAARQLRYAAFAEQKKRFQSPGRRVKVAVAHNLNDNAETMLFHLARGSGIRGLCGIPPVREDIIRPLLSVSRQEVEAYLAQAGQDYCTDETNRSAAYSRNRIRMEALPSLEGVNGRCIWHMQKTAKELTELSDFIKSSAKKRLEACCINLQDGAGVFVQKEGFEQAEAALQKEMLYQLMVKLAGSGRDLTSVHISKLAELFDRQNGRRISLPYGITATRVYGGIELKIQNELDKTEEADAGGIGESIRERFSFRVFEKIFQTEPQISEKKYTKWFDYDKIKSGLCIRNRMPGDYFVLNDDGARQKLKNYLVNEKVPAKEREKLPLLADGQHIMWIVGHRISSYYKVEKHTKRVLEVTFYG